jgi:hypothetical protein
LFNAEAQTTVFALPEGSWQVVLETGDPQLGSYHAEQKVDAPPYCVMMILQEGAQHAAGKVQTLKAV